MECALRRALRSPGLAARRAEGGAVQAPVEAARFADCRAGFPWAALSSILRIAHIRDGSIRNPIFQAAKCRQLLRGRVRVGQGFSVDADKLQKGSQEIGDLLERSLIIAADAVDALAGMAGSAGHVDLVSALGHAEGQGAQTFRALSASYQHAGVGVAASAKTYADTERGIAARAGTIFGKPR